MGSPTTAASGDAKASPFGAARPIDTAAKEKEIEEKKEAAAKEKKEAEEKAREEKREAAKAAKEAEAAEEEKKVEILQRGEDEDASKPEETIETENANGEIIDDKAVKPKEIVRDARPKPSDTGAWRRPSGGPPPPRDDIPRGPRGRGGRGRGEGRGGPRHFDDRAPRQNSNGRGPPPASPSQANTPVPETEVLDADGWSTVSKPKKNNRGGNAGARPIAS